MVCTIFLGYVHHRDLILFEIEKLYLDGEIVGEDAKGRVKIDAKKMNPVGRMGSNEYVSSGELMQMKRPK